MPRPKKATSGTTTSDAGNGITQTGGSGNIPKTALCDGYSCPVIAAPPGWVITQYARLQGQMQQLGTDFLNTAGINQPLTGFAWSDDGHYLVERRTTGTGRGAMGLKQQAVGATA